MEDKRTVIILGAGASKDYGLPTGEELRTKIIDKFIKLATHHFYEPPDVINEYKVTSHGRLVKDEKAMLNEFVYSYKQFIKDFKDSGVQIDLFISRHASNEQYVRFGKLAIALILYNEEMNSSDFNNSKSFYRQLYEQLCGDITTPRIPIFSDKKITIITFNYDRTLEQYLEKTTIPNFKQDMSNVDLYQELDSLKIIHVYGRLGKLPWEISDEPLLKFPIKGDSNTIIRGNYFKKEIINNIHTIHEERKSDGTLKKVRAVIEKAERVYFMGFHYNKENLANLGIVDVTDEKNEHTRSSIEKVKRVYGTGFNLTKNEVDEIKNKYFSGNKPTILGPTQTCYHLLREHPL